MSETIDGWVMSSESPGSKQEIAARPQTGALKTTDAITYTDAPERESYVERRKRRLRIEQVLETRGIVEEPRQRRLRVAYALRGPRSFIVVRSPEASSSDIERPTRFDLKTTRQG